MLRQLTLVGSLLAGRAALLARIAGGSGSAVAQSIGGIEVSVTPYLWIAAPHATTKTPLPNAPTVNSDLSFADVIGHLDGIRFMGSFEMRQGAYGFLGDFIHIPVDTNIATRNIFLAWDYSTKLSLNAGLLRSVSTSPSAAWADALIAAVITAS